MNEERPRIRHGNSNDVPAVRAMWDDLYQHQQAHGLLAELAPNGFDLWAKSVASVLGRFACLLIAELGAEPIGFLTGRVRSPTPPFSGNPVGFISEVYVADQYRGLGIGRSLLDSAKQWFSDQGIERLELQVLCANGAARAAYQRLGWQEELVQMVFQVGSRERKM